MGSYNYFTGKRCNQDWMERETNEARIIRGHGWWNFRKAVIQERGWRCQVCGISPDQIPGFNPKRPNRLLHIHHLEKVRKARHLRFERSNVVVCCQRCHVRLERVGGHVTDAGVFVFRGSNVKAIDPPKEALQQAACSPAPADSSDSLSSLVT